MLFRGNQTSASGRGGPAVQLLLLTVFLVLGYYLGRPIYWTLESRLQDVMHAPEVGEDPLLSSLSAADAKQVAAIEEKRKSRLERTHAAVEAAKQAAISAVEAVIDETDTSARGGGKNEAAAQGAEGTNETFAKGVRSIIHEGKPLLPLLKHKIWERPPKGAIVPAKEEFALRREMVAFWAKSNVIVVTFANFAFIDFVTNWVRHLTDVGVTNVLVGAMDDKILGSLFLQGVPVFDMESGMSSADVGWGTPIFHAMGREKITLINIFLSMDFELLMCDTDMVWLRDPLPWLARWPDADVITSSDLTTKSVDDDGLEDWERAQSAYNIGILHYRPSPVSKQQAREWAELLHSDASIWDQNGFNELMRRQLGPAVADGKGLFYAFDGSLKLGIMPVSIFCSGHTYFVQRLYKVVGLQPFAVHTTFQFAGTPGKKHRLREEKLFYDPPEYYDPPGGVLSYDLNIPEKLLTGGEHNLTAHFALVNYQVMPELWVRFDRIWFPHPGVLPHTNTSQPFLCPMDHIFEVLKSKVLVAPCEEAACPAVPDVAPGVTVALPSKATEEQVMNRLEPFEDIKWLHFLDIESAFDTWTEKERERKFNWRIKHYLGIWCCVDTTPGHIWYDFFADKKPGWTPKPPKDGSEDHPPL